MQELCDSIERPNLQIMGIEKGEEMQAKSKWNIFYKIIAENFPKHEKEVPIQVQEKPPVHQTDITKIEPLHGILYLRQLAQRTRKEHWHLQEKKIK
jgi:hypothetical protein